VAAACTTATCQAAASPVPAPIILEQWRGYPAGSRFVDGTSFGPWVARFNGLGTVSIVNDAKMGPALELSPKGSTMADETHAALVTTAAQLGDFDATVVMLTVKQLRTPTPNGWESAWILWRYVDREHFYYLNLNASGWELGKEDATRTPARRFLITGAVPALVVGRPNTIRIVQRGDTFSVFADSKPIVQFSDYEEPYQVGPLGLYCEDSIVRFGRIVVTTP
jgi:hypothetical protein